MRRYKNLDLVLLDDNIKLDGLYTSADGCVCARLDERNPNLLSELKRNEYDQAPVKTKDGLIVGLVSNGVLKRIERQERAITHRDIGKPASLAVSTSLRELLEALSKNNAILIRREAHSKTYVGLMTISDLNRHAFRIRLYPIMTQAEILLAKLLEKKYPVPEEFLALVSRDRSAIRKSYNASKSQKLDVHPVNSCNFLMMLNILSESKDLLEQLKLGFMLDSAIAPINKFRNTVMHPVGYLVETKGRIREIQTRLNDLDDMSRQISTHPLLSS